MYYNNIQILLVRTGQVDRQQRRWSTFGPSRATFERVDTREICVSVLSILP